jgi:hypothetical protein
MLLVYVSKKGFQKQLHATISFSVFTGTEFSGGLRWIVAASQAEEHK